MCDSGSLAFNGRPAIQDKQTNPEGKIVMASRVDEMAALVDGMVASAQSRVEAAQRRVENETSRVGKGTEDAQDRVVDFMTNRTIALTPRPSAVPALRSS